MEKIQSTLLKRIEDPLFNEYNLEVDVFLGYRLHPVISGNKYMKLHFWMEKARQMNVNHIITKGGPYSNHLHATAFACKESGWQFTAVVKANEHTKSPTLNDLKNWHANCVYVNRAAYYNEEKWENYSKELNALYIPMGGEGEEGMDGVKKFFNEQLFQPYDYLVCSIGTGTTIKGIAGSNLKAGNLIGVQPGIKNYDTERLVNDIKKIKPEISVKIIEDKTLRPFGQFPGFLLDEMNNWYLQWEIPTDVVYTAKMFRVLMLQIAAGRIKSGSRLLLIHTGGLQGNRSVESGKLIF
ncbi:pyridoxal-phosphate dependent enzyme [Polluticaenibacter yanchengensis]|uniref:Pyridoxal-phosphate dependent enzyme n=1 Tax=Polluticaenibacter yanchengensis TaxID=3014562 RepID=A0ABT4UGV6_9BACT|nr:pyridoxal-phosphate dependent enzyme [Chitinophagaceae bacterium LY-5]